MKGLTAHIQISEGRRCLCSFLNHAGSCFILRGSCGSRGFVCFFAGRRRASEGPPDPPDSDGGSGDLLNRHKNTCLFPGLQFTVPEIPSEPVSGVQGGVRGWSLGDTTLPTSGEVTDSLLITHTDCNEEIDTWTLSKSSPCLCNRADAQLHIFSSHQRSWAPHPSRASYIF